MATEQLWPIGKGTLVEVVYAQTGKGGQPKVALQSPVCSDSRGKAFGCSLGVGKPYAVE